MKLYELLHQMVAAKASDLHTSQGSPAQIRVDGQLRPIGPTPLSSEEAQALCFEILTPAQKEKLLSERELDFSFSLEKKSRFRANLFWHQNSVAGAFRQIPFQIPAFAELGLPSAIAGLIQKPNGLVLVTGATGSGKSTTLAAMIQMINETKPWHIMTVEDPTEFMFISKKSLIQQREIGKDTKNFQSALKYVLREDPDVVMIGEMRDLETIQAALTIAETGHLVLTTLHTNTAVQTIDRIIDVFPAHQQSQVRVQLSFTLQAILSQQLLPKIGGGRCLALEILLPNMAIRNLIRESKTHQIYSQLQTGQATSGMQTMNQALAQLVRKKIISKEEAVARSTDPEELRSLM